jgi:cysteine desulfurase
VRLAPIVLGGGQEGGFRSGTENLPAIVGMGVAADLARNERAAEVARLSPLRDRLLEGLLERVAGARLTGARGAGRLPHHASVVVSGVKADAVLLELDMRGIAASCSKRPIPCQQGRGLRLPGSALPKPAYWRMVHKRPRYILRRIPRV